MEQENFTQELQKLSPFLAQLRDKAQTTMAAPTQYFEHLEDKILEKIDNELDIEKDILPSELKNWQPTAPNYYFENLTERVLEKAKPQETQKKQKALLAQLYNLKISRATWWVAAASVAILLGFAWSFWQSQKFNNQQLAKNNNIQVIDNQNFIAKEENKIAENLPQEKVEKNTPMPVTKIPNAEIITPTTAKATDLNPTTTHENNLESLVMDAQKAYQNSKNDVEILNKNLEKILLDANTEGGELLDLFHFSDEDLESAIGGGR